MPLSTFIFLTCLCGVTSTNSQRSKQHRSHTVHVEGNGRNHHSGAPQVATSKNALLESIARIENSPQYKKPTSARRAKAANLADAYSASAIEATSALSTGQAVTSGAAYAASLIERSPKYKKATSARSAEHMSALEAASYSDHRSTEQTAASEAASAAAAIEYSSQYNKPTSARSTEHMSALLDAYTKSAVEDSSKYNKAIAGKDCADNEEGLKKIAGYHPGLTCQGFKHDNMCGDTQDNCKLTCGTCKAIAGKESTNTVHNCASWCNTCITHACEQDPACAACDLSHIPVV